MHIRKAIYGVIAADSSISLAHAQLEEVIVTATKTASTTPNLTTSRVAGLAPNVALKGLYSTRGITC